MEVLGNVGMMQEGHAFNSCLTTPFSSFGRLVAIPPGEHRLLFNFAEIVFSRGTRDRTGQGIAHDFRFDWSCCGLWQLRQELGHALRDLTKEWTAKGRLTARCYFAPVDSVVL
jgi:hypothetical protein